MLKSIIKIVVFLGLSAGLYAESGLSQNHLLSVSPSALETGVSPDMSVEVKFDLPIKTKSVKKHTIVLKQNHNKIKGVTTLVDDNTLRFTPSETLKEGDYKVKVKNVKLQKEDNEAQHEPKTGFEKFIYWLCSLFYDNPADCTLCKKICGNSNNSIKTQKINYSFIVDDSPKIVSILLSETAIELDEGNTSTITVTANYDDNTTQDIRNDAEWSIGDSSIVSVINGTAEALKEGITTLQAKYEGKTSDILNITVYKEVNGYRLPPEPDPAVNNTTLLGVDSNGNGVRDDVERWIYITYKDKHPIHVDVAMQAGKAWQKVLEDPSKAKEIHHIISGASSCEAYFAVCVKDSEKRKYNIGRISSSDIFIRAIFNTNERWDAYMQYDSLLSGATYVIPWCSEKKDLCNFDISKYEQ